MRWRCRCSSLDQGGRGAGQRRRGSAMRVWGTNSRRLGWSSRQEDRPGMQPWSSGLGQRSLVLLGDAKRSALGVRRGRAGMRFQIYPLVCWRGQRNVSSRRGRWAGVSWGEGKTGWRQKAEAGSRRRERVWCRAAGLADGGVRRGRVEGARSEVGPP
jgi:hypothetical protein